MPATTGSAADSAISRKPYPVDFSLTDEHEQAHLLVDDGLPPPPLVLRISNRAGRDMALLADADGRRGLPTADFHHFRLDFRPDDLADWGALGGLIGRRMGSYFDVPLVSAAGPSPGSDALKHFGAALASYGSTPMFHIEGITPEANTIDEATGGRKIDGEPLTRTDLDAFYDGFRKDGDHVDVVVFAAPQLSLYEIQLVARLLEGRRIRDHVAVLITAPPEVVRAAERMGLRATIEAAGARILEGVCFYQMYAREMGEMMGWKRLLTNSAKLANIIQGYGYEPVLQPTARCIEAAIAGRLA